MCVWINTAIGKQQSVFARGNEAAYNTFKEGRAQWQLQSRNNNLIVGEPS